VDPGGRLAGGDRKTKEKPKRKEEKVKSKSSGSPDYFFFDDFFPFFFDVFLDVLRAAFLAAMLSVTPFCSLTLAERLKASVLNRAREAEVGAASRDAREDDGGRSECVPREAAPRAPRRGDGRIFPPVARAHAQQRRVAARRVVARARTLHRIAMGAARVPFGDERVRRWSASMVERRDRASARRERDVAHIAPRVVARVRRVPPLRSAWRRRRSLDRIPSSGGIRLPLRVELPVIWGYQSLLLG
jgi:hypothetical protein